MNAKPGTLQILMRHLETDTEETQKGVWGMRKLRHEGIALGTLPNCKRCPSTTLISYWSTPLNCYPDNSFFCKQALQRTYSNQSQCRQWIPMLKTDYETQKPHLVLVGLIRAGTEGNLRTCSICPVWFQKMIPKKSPTLQTFLCLHLCCQLQISVHFLHIHFQMLQQ